MSPSPSAPVLFPPMFEGDYRPSTQNRRDLIVSMSSSTGFAFYRANFDAPTLFLIDKVNFYYMRGFDALYLSIKELIELENFDRIIFLGVSKSGWGGLSLAYLLAARDKSRTYHCLAFSPQTQVWPLNTNIKFPSYKRMIERSATDTQLMKMLVHRGSLPGLNLPNLVLTIYYGAQNAIDSVEAARLTGTSVKLVPLPISGHLSHLPFVCDGTNRTVCSILLKRASAQGRAVGDDIPEDDHEPFLDELEKLGKQPDVTTLVRVILEQGSVHDEVR